MNAMCRFPLLVVLFVALAPVTRAAQSPPSPALSETQNPVVDSASNALLEPDMVRRLEKLSKELDAQRQALHIPGMALAVVQGDRLIYAHGFGLSNLKEGTPVTAETIFAIGSATKAFTSALVGMGVDQGIVSWDDPVTKYLPYFQLKVKTKEADSTVTLRDLLAHRTGFTRMGILWVGGRVSAEDVLRTAATAEPLTSFRGKFYYNNVTFMAAGMALSVATGKSWETLLAQEIFKPLGMTSSSSSILVAQKDARLSLGYVWDEEAGKFNIQPMRPLQAIAPAGAINSNVLDMAQWIRFQLRHGSFEGKTLLSESQHAEAWKKQIQISPEVDYGFGWMLHQIGNQRVVEHGGNIDGFAAEVGLFPDADLGFVLLTNVTATSLQQASLQLVEKTLLADWPQGDETQIDAQELESYVGKYTANFGTFKDAIFTVMRTGNGLAVDVPGQMLYQLDPPKEDGKWYFSLTDQIAVSFDYEASAIEGGDVVGMKMYQGGMTFELPREGVVREAEIDLSALQPYLGKYHFEEGGIDFEVKIAQQRLAVDVPGEMLYELFPPNAEGLWVFRATDKVAVEFVQSDSGSIDAMNLYRGGVLQSTLPRMEKQEDSSAPTFSDLLALRPFEDGAKTPSFRMTGRVQLLSAGVEGKFSYISDGHRRFRVDMDFGEFGWTHQAVGEGQGWMDSNMSPFRKLEGKFLSQALVEQVLLIPEDWSQFFDTVTVTGNKQLGDRSAALLQMKVADLPPMRAAVDSETGDLLRFEMSTLDPDLGIAVRTLTRFEDYRTQGAMRVAFRRVSRNEFNGKTILEIDRLETGIPLEDSLFAAPEDR